MGVPWLFRCTLFCSVFLIPVSSSPAQVVIRDTLRIGAGPDPNVSSVSNSTMTLVFAHNGIVDMSPSRSRAMVLRNRFCGGGTTVQVVGPVTVASIPARGPGVEANMSCRIIGTSELARSFGFYLDGELVDSLYFVTDCSVACVFQGHIQSVPLYTSFAFGVDDPVHPFELDHGQTTQKFTLSYSSVLCGSTVWHPNCATTVRVIEGAELGTLVGPDGSNVGDVFVGKANDIKQLRFSANGVQPTDESGVAVVEVSSRGITSRVTFEIRRTVPPLHHFRVLVDPDTIHHGSSAQLFVTAMDAQDRQVSIPDDARLDLFVGTGFEQFGDLGALNEGEPKVGDQLFGVRYDQARSGGAVYLANGENHVGSDPVVVPLGAQIQGNPGVAGFGEVVVGCRIDPPHYKQGDPSWANEHYDSAYSINGKDTATVGIKTLGCALSCMAMAMTAFGDTVRPDELNAFKKNETTAVDFRFSGDRVRWRAMARTRALRINEPVDVDSGFDPAELDGLLARCGLVIARVFNSESVKNKPKDTREKAEKQGNHWVLIKGKSHSGYDILDPGRGLRKLSEYSRIYRYVTIQEKKEGV
jgi:hypothetical protein